MPMPEQMPQAGGTIFAIIHPSLGVTERNKLRGEWGDV
jgi:hypothetical protein